MNIWKLSNPSGRFASLSEALSIKSGSRVAFAGSGGKTTLLYQLAEELASQGKKVLILTTTHMELPKGRPFFPEASSFAVQALSEGLAVIGRVVPETEKFTYPGEAFLREMEPLADVLLVEADGSRRLPAKFPSRYEPVIPSGSTHILVVTGMSAIGRPFGEAFHRYALAVRAGYFDGDPKALITAADLMAVQKNAYLLPLREGFPRAAVLPVWNQADSPKEAALARETLLKAGEREGLITCR